MIKNTLRIAFNILENFQLSHLLHKNEELLNRHAGQKAFLFATGTSLTGVDLSEFNGGVTFGCNNIFKHPSFPGFKLDYYTAGVPYRSWRQVSPRFTHKDHHQFFSDVNAAFRDRSTKHFYHVTMHKYLKEHGLLPDVSPYYFLRKGGLEVAKSQSVDLTRPITFADGGLTLMIALAIYMGCKEIYLFGCGYTYSPVQLFHFNDCFRCPSGLTKIEMEAATNAFRLTHPESDFRITRTNSHPLGDKEVLIDFNYLPPVQSGNTESDFYHTHRIIKSFAESKGVRIVNVTPPGYSSPVYESIPKEILLDRMQGGADKV